MTNSNKIKIETEKYTVIFDTKTKDVFNGEGRYLGIGKVDNDKLIVECNNQHHEFDL